MRAAILVASLLAYCNDPLPARAADPARFETEAKRMGTTFRLVVYA